MKGITTLGVVAGALLAIGSQVIYTVNPGERVIIM